MAGSSSGWPSTPSSTRGSPRRRWSIDASTTSRPTGGRRSRSWRWSSATSGTGVGFTRDPRTGEHRFYAEFLINAQGEDVVAGIRTPERIEALRDRMPDIYAELLAIADRLERHYKDMQDIEFTVQEAKLYLLQTRSGKRSPRA